MTRRDGVAFVLGALVMAALLLMTSCATPRVAGPAFDAAPLSGWDMEGTEGCTRGWLGVGQDAEGVLIVPVLRCSARQPV